MQRDPIHTPPRPSTEEEVQRVLEAAERARHASESPFDPRADQSAQGTERARQTGDKVADKISATGHKAAEKADQAASAVSNQTHRSAEQAEDLKQTAHEKQRELSARADATMTSTGQHMTNVAQTLREKAPQGRAGEFAGRAASALEQGGDYLQRSNPEMVRMDLETTIRNHPIESLLVGLGVGFIIARMTSRRSYS